MAIASPVLEEVSIVSPELGKQSVWLLIYMVTRLSLYRLIEIYYFPGDPAPGKLNCPPFVLLWVGDQMTTYI